MGGEALVYNPLSIIGVLLKVEGELFGDSTLHQALHLDVTQLTLGLPLKLRFSQLDAYNGGKPLPDIIAYQVGLVIFEEPIFMGIVVKHPG